MKLTKAHLAALSLLAEGDSGVLDKRGKITVLGRTSSLDIHGEHEEFHTKTWLYLISHGLVYGEGGRFYISVRARNLIKPGALL